MKLTKWCLILFAAGAMYLAGCGSTGPDKDPNQIRFRYWGDTEEINIIEGMLKEFEAKHPGVTIKAERKAADSSYADVLQSEFAADNAPDVIFASTDNIELLDSSGKLENLMPFLEKDSDINASDYYDASIKRFSKDGRLMVLPRDIAPIVCVYYNKNIFDKAGIAYPQDEWNWEDMRRIAKKLTKRDERGIAVQLGFADDWNIAEQWVLSGGGRFVDDYFNPTRVSIADPDSKAGVLFRWEMVHKDKVMPTAADNQAFNGGSMAMFLNGKVAMFHSGIWKTPTFRKITDFKWDVVRFPTRKNAKNVAYYSGGSGYTMSKDVADKELCWELIKFMAGPEGQSRLATTGLAQPALKKLAASELFLDGKDPKNKKMLIYAAENALCSPAWKPYQEMMRSIWSPKTDLIWVTGYDGDPEVVIKDAADAANRKFFKIR